MKPTLKSILCEINELPCFSGIKLDNPNIKNGFGESALDTAVVMGRKDYVLVLLEAGANINQRCERGNTALHEAIAQDQYEIAEILLQNGADILIKNDDGHSAITFLEMIGSKQMKEVFFKSMGVAQLR